MRECGKKSKLILGFAMFAMISGVAAPGSFAKNARAEETGGNGLSLQPSMLGTQNNRNLPPSPSASPSPSPSPTNAQAPLVPHVRPTPAY